MIILFYNNFKFIKTFTNNNFYLDKNISVYNNLNSKKVLLWDCINKKYSKKFKLKINDIYIILKNNANIFTRIYNDYIYCFLEIYFKLYDYDNNNLYNFNSKLDDNKLNILNSDFKKKKLLLLKIIKIIFKNMSYYLSLKISNLTKIHFNEINEIISNKMLEDNYNIFLDLYNKVYFKENKAFNTNKLKIILSKYK